MTKAPAMTVITCQALRATNGTKMSLPIKMKQFQYHDLAYHTDAL